MRLAVSDPSRLRAAAGLLALTVAAVLLGVAPAPAQEDAEPKYAILIVGDERSAEMQREEKALIAEMTRLLPKHPNAQTLQVFSYHFDKDREKVYCEKALNVLQEDLLFVGLVELKDRVPRKVVYRLDRIVRASRSAADILARAEEILAAEAVAATPGETSPPKAVEPARTPAPPAQPPAAEKPPSETARTGWRVQVGSFAEMQNAQDLVSQLKVKGYDSRIDHSNRGGHSLFRVYVGNYTNRQKAQETLDRLKSDGFDKAFVAAPEEAGGSPGRPPGAVAGPTRAGESRHAH